MRIEPPKSAELTVPSAREVGALSNRDTARAELASVRAIAELPPLELGQELVAEVIDEPADGRVLLQIGGALVEAENPGQLHAGQSLRLQVELLQPRVILQIVGQELTLEDQLRNLILQRLPGDPTVSLIELQRSLGSDAEGRDHSALATTLEKLKAFMIATLPQGGNWTAEKLRQFVHDFGLHYEAKLVRAVAAERQADLSQIADDDLKGLLLRLLEELPATLAASDSLDRVERKLTDIEGQQAANLLAQLKGEAVQLRVPLFFGNATSEAAIAIDAEGDQSAADRQNSGKKSGYRIYFALDLENFGRTRIDLQVHHDDISGVFYLDRELSLRQLNQALPNLQSALRAQGYRGISLLARPLRELTAEQEQKFAALVVGVPSNMQLVNLKV